MCPLPRARRRREACLAEDPFHPLIVPLGQAILTIEFQRFAVVGLS